MWDDRYCRNCEALKRGAGSADQVAVNCGNHQWVSRQQEEEEDIQYRDSCDRLATLLRSIGFEVYSHEVSLKDDGIFSFDHKQPLTFLQLDRLATTFKTKEINFTKGPGYWDTHGHHEEGWVEVKNATIPSSP